MDPSDPAAFNAVFGLIVAFIVVLVVVSVGLSIYRAKRVVDAGHNPLTLDTDIALRVLDSDILSPTKPAADALGPMEKRLAEVDALFAKGSITEAEHATARASILTGS